ncbi:hypothetical protein REMIM1_PC00197 (plasmid) [Rhizobium etli bv. mimosae str. Mim1]|nr:hypothetical protein REMIM1_PC00197 [Rhizobium etli bv. mimosae str. Mim1]
MLPRPYPQAIQRSAFSKPGRGDIRATRDRGPVGLEISRLMRASQDRHHHWAIVILLRYFAPHDVLLRNSAFFFIMRMYEFPDIRL